MPPSTLPGRLAHVVVAVAGLAVVAALGIQPAQAREVARAEGPGSAGSAGIGDSYYPKDGNGGYQVVHYDINDRYRIRSGRLTGVTDVHAVAKKDLTRFNLDLVLDPVEVSIGGSPVEFTKAGKHELVVTPASTIPAGTSFVVSVLYGGRPADIPFEGYHPWISSKHEAMAMNQPQIAPWWFPANDHPRDKATFDITVEVPRGKQVISNGRFVGKQVVGDEWTAWHWRMAEKSAPYLAFFAAGDFAWEQGRAKGLDYVNAVSKRLPKRQRHKAMGLMRRSPGVVRWLETQVGDYPFGSTGGVTTALDSGFALENQTRPTYPYLGRGPYALSIVVHELAHQWFGDDVAVDRWRDIWLNEGFATWFEWKYAGTHGGRTPQRSLERYLRYYPRHDPMWKVKIGNPGKRHIFDDAVYDRGAMAIQALRNRIGNHDFTHVLRRWVHHNAGGTARIGDFERLAKQVSGEHLDGFFDHWLFTPSRPRRTVANGLK